MDVRLPDAGFYLWAQLCQVNVDRGGVDDDVAFAQGLAGSIQCHGFAGQLFGA